jgi:hypothetical protein
MKKRRRATNRPIVRAALKKIKQHGLCECSIDERYVATEADRLADVEPPRICESCGKIKLIAWGVAEDRIVLGWPAKEGGEQDND